MTHLRHRAPGKQDTTWLTVGVRGPEAARIGAEAKAYARAKGVTFGSLVLEALASYMDDAWLEARANAREAEGRE